MSKWIMLPSGKQVYCDEDGRPLKARPEHAFADTVKSILDAAREEAPNFGKLHYGECTDSCLCKKPFSLEPVVSRRFCACGQELFGRLLAAGSACCGECVLRTSIARREGTSLAGRHLDPYRNQKPTQPEVEEHAWESTHWSWP